LKPWKTAVVVESEAARARRAVERMASARARARVMFD